MPQQTTIPRLTDTEWQALLEFGGSEPRSRADMARTTPTRLKKAGQVQTCQPDGRTRAQAQVGELFGPRVKVYSLDTRANRVRWARNAVAFAPLPLMIGAMLLALGASVGGWLIFFGIPVAFTAIAHACYSISEPYEVRIAPSGLVRFARISGNIDIHAADILRLVRCQAQSSGRVTAFKVVHRGGSITVREDIFTRLAALCPAAQAATEVYDDTTD